MSYPTQNEFLTMLAGIGKGGNSPGIKTARVVSINDGQTVIQFDEDSVPSQKIYIAFKSYNPAVGDRVMLFNGIIIGGWKP